MSPAQNSLYTSIKLGTLCHYIPSSQLARRVYMLTSGVKRKQHALDTLAADLQFAIWMGQRSAE